MSPPPRLFLFKEKSRLFFYLLFLSKKIKVEIFFKYVVIFFLLLYNCGVKVSYSHIIILPIYKDKNSKEPVKGYLAELASKKDKKVTNLWIFILTVA